MSLPDFVSLDQVLMEVEDERVAQDAKFGEQNCPDGTSNDLIAKCLADDYRRVCQQATDQDRLTWKHILLEEVFEALAETDQTRLRTELIQVAAVAVSWVQAVDRRTTEARSAQPGVTNAT